MNTIIDCLFDFYSKPENMKAYEEWCKEQDALEQNRLPKEGDTK